MAKNYGPTRSSWPNEPLYSSYNGYERPVDRRQRTSGNEAADSLATRSGGRHLRHKETTGQVDIDALLAATQVNNCSKGEFVKRLTQAVGDN